MELFFAFKREGCQLQARKPDERFGEEMLVNLLSLCLQRHSTFSSMLPQIVCPSPRSVSLPLPYFPNVAMQQISAWDLLSVSEKNNDTGKQGDDPFGESLHR